MLQKLHKLLTFKIILIIPIIVLIVLRIPSLFESFWYGDEGIYAAVAQSMQQGKILYSGIWDHKPPFIFAPFYLAAYIGWETGYFLLKIFNITLGIAALILTSQILKRNVGNSPRFIALLLLSLLLGSTIFEGNSLNAEVIFIVFNLAILLLLLSKKSFYIVGFLAFLTLITKMPGFVEFCIVFLAFLTLYIKEEGKQFITQAIIKTASGFVIPLTVMLTLFYTNGSLTDFLDANIIFNTYYSFDETNYIRILNEPIPNITFQTISAVSVFIFTTWLCLKKRISTFTYLAIILFVAQLFASLLSGRNYGHYFIQVLPAVALLTALLVQNITRISKQKILYSSLVTILLLPMIFVLVRGEAIPIYAPPREYYTSFINGYVLGNNTAKEEFWWRNGMEVEETNEIAHYLNNNYKGEDNIYIYSDKPWILALTDHELTNKYVVWFHLTPREKHLEEGLDNMNESNLVVVENKNHIPQPVAELLQENFKKTDTFKNFDMYRKLSEHEPGNNKN